MCIDTIAPIICYIINLRITTGIVPRRWKTAVRIPLYKEGDRNCTSNYRPVSVPPVVSKGMGRVVYEHLRAQSAVGGPIRVQKIPLYSCFYLKIVEQHISKYG